MSDFGESSRGDNGNRSGHDDDETNLEKNTTSKIMSTRCGKRKLRSDVWNHYITKDLGSGFRHAKCKYCGHEYERVTSKTGTGNLKRHLEGCPRKSSRDISELVSLGGRSKFDNEHFRDLLCRAIIMHDLPFRFVEYEGIRAIFEYLKWDIKIVGRNTLKDDLLKMYEREKKNIRCVLDKTPGRLSLTSDCWSSITTDGYISLTCHFIDEEWVLQKRVLNFSLMPSPHTGVALSNKIFSMLCDWGIEKKLFSLTLDNASANDVSVELLLTQLNLNNALVCNGEFFHIRCCAHIVNLVVQDGLNDIEGAVIKVRESIKFVRGSQMRRQKFLDCVNKLGLSNKRGLRQDVPTRWNSTFLMLDNALYYRRAFMNFQLSDTNYKHCPSTAEWDKIDKIRGFLSLFYDVSNLFSGSKYPTANLYFGPVVMCYTSLKQSMNNPDDYIRKMASKMLPKFEKYWSEFSLILTIAAVFDPRCKLQFVDFSYKKLYGPESEKFLLVKEKLFALFGDYSTCSTVFGTNQNLPLMDPSCNFTNEASKAALEEFSALADEFGMSQAQKSQLELYLEETRMDIKSNLDILGYWKGMQFKYPIVACMARDILSIPITTVASESVFSVGGRVIDQYRSSLKPSTVEGIICTRDWLFGKKVFTSELPTEELAEDFLSVNVENQSEYSASTASSLAHE